MINCFIGDLEHSNPLLTQMKRNGIIKCIKVKFWAYQDNHYDSRNAQIKRW